MATELVFKKEHPEKFWELWSSCLNITKAGPKYSRINLEYGFEYTKSKNFIKIDYSFIFLRDGKPLACILLPIEEVGGKTQISWGGGYVFAPLFVDNSCSKEVFSIIEKISRENSALKIMMEIDPLSGEPFNYLQKFNYLDSSILCYAISLEGEKTLLNSCRHGHKYDINRFSKDPKVKLFCVDKDSPDSWERHEQYRELHRKCSGRVTRSKESFDKQYEQLKNGEALISVVEYEGKNVASSYFTFLNDSALYFSGADDPDFAGLPLYHSMVFKAMEYLQGKGVKRIDVGQPASPSAQFQYYPDEKQMNIALFKRGFGGDFTPYFRGVKYFSEQEFIADQSEFAEKYRLMLNK